MYDQIRKKALIQYTLPFVSVDLSRMADAFKTSVSGLERELEALITDNQIQVRSVYRKSFVLSHCHFKTFKKEHFFHPEQARIDSHNKILYARHADQRNATFQKVLQMGNEFDRDTRAMLLRANLLKHEYHARAARKL